MTPQDSLDAILCFLLPQNVPDISEKETKIQSIEERVSKGTRSFFEERGRNGCVIFEKERGRNGWWNFPGTRKGTDPFLLRFIFDEKGSMTASELCKFNCVRKIFFIECVRTMQTMSEGCKLSPKRDANCVRRLQTMSEGCKLCPKCTQTWS